MKAIGRNRLAKANNLAVVAVGLLLALAFARPAPALTWEIDTVDTAGDVGLWTSIALDSSDAPHVSYFDKSNGNLKYGRKLPLGLWATATVDSAGRVGEFTSMALDSGGSPHISYLAYVVDGNRDLKYARRLPSGDWSTETVDSAGDVGWFPSTALDPSGQPHISYYEFASTSGTPKLKYARRSPSGQWSVETVDSEGDVGAYTSIALDSSGNPHISYFDFSNSSLKYARKVCTRIVLKTGSVGTFCSWSKGVVDAGGEVTSGPTSIALDSSGLPHIGYTALVGGYPQVRYARRSSSGSWTIETVDVGGVGFHVAMVLDATDRPHLSYPDNTNGTLKYARKMILGIWMRETVDTGFLGMNSIALDSSGNPHISYHDVTNGNLKYARGHFGASEWP